MKNIISFDNEYTMCFFNLFMIAKNLHFLDDLLIKDSYNEINHDIIPKSKLCFPDIHPSNVEIKIRLYIQKKMFIG